jgi:hypothetical protein
VACIVLLLGGVGLRVDLLLVGLRFRLRDLGVGLRRGLRFVGCGLGDALSAFASAFTTAGGVVAAGAVVWAKAAEANSPEISVASNLFMSDLSK